MAAHATAGERAAVPGLAAGSADTRPAVPAGGLTQPLAPVLPTKVVALSVPI